MRGQRGSGRGLPGRLLLAAALGALALFAIPAVGLADHGHHHGTSDPAGTVKSFDQETGVLTIDLAEGGDIEGLVTDRTRIRCRNDNHRENQRHNRRHRGHATASDSGPGRDGSGDDNSGPGNSADDGGDHHAEEPGEDNHQQGDEPGEDNHGERGDDDGDNEHHGRNERCMAQLEAGATVRRAELELEDGMAVFEKVTLAS